MPEADVTIGEVARTVDRIAVDISALRAESVMRSEYEVRLSAMDREIRDVKDQLARRDEVETSQKPTWPQVVTAVAAVVTLLVLLVTIITVAQYAPPAL